MNDAASESALVEEREIGAPASRQLRFAGSDGLAEFDERLVGTAGRWPL
ncbi:hypothetical protein [Micromonospora sp. NPDC126480]